MVGLIFRVVPGTDEGDFDTLVVGEGFLVA